MVRYVAAIDVLVYLDGSGQADLTAKENALNAALLVPYPDVVLYQDSGAATGTKLINNASLSGVRITDGPSYTNEAQDGEYVIQRACRFTAEAEFVVAGTAAAVLSWTESVSILGSGGPLIRWRPTVNGPPIQQVVYPLTTTRAVQTGQAVGHMARPSAPPPLWPLAELGDRRALVAGSPQRLGQGFIAWPQSWHYEFEALGPLVGFPSLPPL